MVVAITSWSVHPPQYCYGGRAGALSRFRKRTAFFNGPSHGLRRRKNLALPVAGSCTLRSLPLTVERLVTAFHETAGSKVEDSRT